MKNGDPIPYITHHHVHLDQLKCDQMIKYDKKDQYYFNIIDQVRIRDSLAIRSLFHLFPPCNI